MAEESSLIRGHPHQVICMTHFHYHCTPFVPDSRAIYAFSKTVYDEASDFLHVIEPLYPLLG